MNYTYAVFPQTLYDEFIGTFKTFGIMCLENPQFLINDVSVDYMEACNILKQLHTIPPTPPEKLIDTVLALL